MERVLSCWIVYCHETILYDAISVDKYFRNINEPKDTNCDNDGCFKDTYKVAWSIQVMITPEEVNWIASRFFDQERSAPSLEGCEISLREEAPGSLATPNKVGLERLSFIAGKSGEKNLRNFCFPG
jgi:hypothetical protein